MKKALYLRSGSGDPFYNLAAEEFILEHRRDCSPVLFIWQSDGAVVIGRHQNPWAETDAEFLDREGIVLARRKSGGGAVYQDRGNLNFALITDRAAFDVSRQTDAVCRALAACGISAETGRMSRLYLSGRKISGSAFLLRRHRALHHGTLLVDADMNMMASLRGVMRITDRRGVASSAEETVNIAAVHPGASIDACAAAIRAQFEELAGCRFEAGDIGAVCSGSEFSALVERQRSWEWRYGTTPPFDLELDEGAGRVAMHVEKGLVGSITIEPCGEVVYGGGGSVRFRAEEIHRALEGTGLRLEALDHACP